MAGDAPSLAMLLLMASGYEAASHKKITASPRIVVIDESNIFDAAESPIPKILDVVRSCHDMPRQTFIVPYEAIFDENFLAVFKDYLQDKYGDNVIDFKECNGIDWNNLLQKARNVFQNVSTLTAREDIYESLRYQLLFKISATLNAKKVMTPTTSNDLAVRLLSAVANGQGSQIPFQASYLDMRVPEMVFINTMREFTTKECVYFTMARGIRPITRVRHSTLHDPITASIHKAAETFVSSLQASFSSTVPTVLKTAQKICSTGESSRSCTLCLLPIHNHGSCGDQNILQNLEIDDVCFGCKTSLQESNVSLPRTQVEDVLNEFLISS